MKLKIILKPISKNTRNTTTWNSKLEILLYYLMRLHNMDLNKHLDQIEDQIKAFGATGEGTWEVLKMVNPDKYIVKHSTGPRYVVNVRPKVDRSILTPGARVALNTTTYTVMRVLPTEVDPQVYSMVANNPTT